MRDPTSSFTFTNFLHQQNRLAAFINRDSNIPSRREWNAYLYWAAKRMGDIVSYGQEVISMEPVGEYNEAPCIIRFIRIVTRDVKTGQIVSRLAKNIFVAVGGIPHLPESLAKLYKYGRNSKASSLVIHSSSFLPSLACIDPSLRAREARRKAKSFKVSAAVSNASPHVQSKKAVYLRFAVIGSGQSAAEISLHLCRVFPTSHISLLFRASALVPSDDSAFVNSAAFDPGRTDTFWQATEADRVNWLSEFRRTNLSVVRQNVLNALHTIVYDQNIPLDQPWPNADGPFFQGQLHIYPNTQIEHAEQIPCVDNSEEHAIALTLSNLRE